MKTITTKKSLLPPLQIASGVVDLKSDNEALSFVVLREIDGKFYFIGSNGDMEVRMQVDVDFHLTPDLIYAFEGKKLLDICKSFSDADDLVLSFSDNNTLLIKSQAARFSIPYVTGLNFPFFKDDFLQNSFVVNSQEIKKILSLTYFSIAQSDVRTYLVGMLWEVFLGKLFAVSSDGHRLSVATTKVDKENNNDGEVKLIIPRKAILELMRILPDAEGEIQVSYNQSCLRIQFPGIVFYTRLINSKFPNHQTIIPQEYQLTMELTKDVLRKAVQRVAILSNERNKAVRFCIENSSLKLSASNAEAEFAEEVIAIGDTVPANDKPLEVCFNSQYLLDILGVLNTKDVVIKILDQNSPMLITADSQFDVKYVIMPMAI